MPSDRAARAPRRLDPVLVSSIGVVVLSSLLAFCTVARPPTGRAEEAVVAISGPAMPIPYDLVRPDWSKRLPNPLHEISGIAIDPTGAFAWAVDDERGRLHRIDLADGAVTADVRFGKRGDYEDLERLGEAVVVVRSDGRLIQVDEAGATIHDSPLPNKCDVEGLAFDPNQRRLLVACKGGFKWRGFGKRQRLVFAVRVPEFEWVEDPVYVIDQRALRAFIEAREPPGVKPGQAKDFGPSAIAVEPGSGDVYVLSSTGKMLVVLDGAQGHIREVTALPRAVHAQPEGLAFGPDRALYISNEGRQSHAVLHRFDRLDAPHGASSQQGPP